MQITRHWDLNSMLFYILIACVGLVCLQISKRNERLKGGKNNLFSWPYIILWFTWTIMAAGRLVNDQGVGGTDAYAYAITFESIKGLSTTYSLERLSHFGAAWTWACKVISNFSTNYHVFFFVIYGFIAFSFIKFLYEFVPTKINLIPLFLTTYPIIISFNTLRTSITIALILLCCVCIKKKKPIWCIPLGVLSVMLQNASIIYVAFIPFYYFFKRYKFTLKKAAVFSIISYAIGIFVRYIFSSRLIKVQYYSNYAERSYTASFFGDYWKIVLGQLLLIVALVFSHKFINAYKMNGSEEDKYRMDFVWMMCMFDLMLVPFCYMIWMWRGCQYFYFARLIMWGEIISIGNKMIDYGSRNIFKIMAFCIFLAWMILMVSVNAYRSGLMPYIFNPFSTL